MAGETGGTTDRLLNRLQYAAANKAADVTTAATNDRFLIADTSDDYEIKWADGANLLEAAGVTASAAEINVLDGVTAGTTTASKALVVGASKELDVLALTTVQIDTGTKTATATAGAATLNKSSGKITSEALTTAAAAEYTLTLTNSAIAAADIVLASVAYGTATAGTPVITRITPASGSVVILVKNDHATNAFDGTIVISFVVFKA